MAEPFKNLIHAGTVAQAGQHLRRVWPAFDRSRFESLATTGLETLDLKARAMLLADALEALFGAVYLDGGYPEISRVIERLYRPILAHIDLRTFGKDPKTLLQELVQGRGHPLPHYEVVATRGAAHDQMFDVVCEIAPLGIRVQASGSSRRAAEQAAAGQAIVAIEALGPARRASRRRKPAQLSLPVAVAQDTPKSQKEQDKK